MSRKPIPAPRITAKPVAVVTRGELVESVHLGHVAATLPGGRVFGGAGDSHAIIYARSSLKPLQALAMVRNGLDLAPALLALACASHNGEEKHLDGVREILASVNLTASVLDNTPDFPYDANAAIQWHRANRGKEPLAQNCSGKHAAMVVTCVINGWPTSNYRDPAHPLQQAIRATIAELTSSKAAHTTVDGCGAPLFSCSLDGLAAAFGTLAAAPGKDPGSPEARVAGAMSGNPFMVGGTGRDVTTLMAGVPGLVAKDGAEGVYAVGLPDGRGAALKILDGSQRARPVVMAAVLGAMGVAGEVLEEISWAPVLGHGRPVGQVQACLFDNV